jgi:hypothetical protein
MAKQAQIVPLHNAAKTRSIRDARIMAADKLPDYTQYPTVDLVDELEAISAEIAAIDEQDAAIKTVLLDRGQKVNKGHFINAIRIDETPTSIFDKEAFINDFGQEFYNRYVKPGKNRKAHIQLKAKKAR